MGKILVVDDDMMNRRMAQYILSKAGHESETVESGEEAIRSIEREEYDLVLLDIEMPEMNGFEEDSYSGKRGRSSGHVPYSIK